MKTINIKSRIASGSVEIWKEIKTKVDSGIFRLSDYKNLTSMSDDYIEIVDHLLNLLGDINIMDFNQDDDVVDIEEKFNIHVKDSQMLDMVIQSAYRFINYKKELPDNILALLK